MIDNKRYLHEANSFAFAYLVIIRAFLLCHIRRIVGLTPPEVINHNFCYSLVIDALETLTILYIYAFLVMHNK